MKTEIKDCSLPLTIQKLYIKRLKHMIERWEYSGICSHCPTTKHYKPWVSEIKELNGIDLCQFCRENVRVYDYNCPCNELKPKEALKRAKDFIERFEVQL